MPAEDERGTVLYDASCGFCSWWILFWKNTLNHRGYGIASLQHESIRESLDVSEDNLLNDILLLLPDKTLVRGADVYRHVMRYIWWALPVYLFSVIPIGRQVFDWGYKTFNRNRYFVSKACRLPAEIKEQ